MSIPGLSTTTTTNIKKHYHRTNDSDELDVFEAANYFSGYNCNMEASNYNNYITTPKVIMRDELDKRLWRGGRMSLDFPLRSSSSSTNNTTLHDHAMVENHKMLKEQKSKSKYKQPSSPGGRLASFLNSLFNQTSSKKKIKSTDLDKDDHHETLSHGGLRRKLRRSSISHFRSSSSETKSLHSSSSASGFRTPTPTKTLVYKDFNNKKVLVVPQQSELNKKDKDLSFLDEKAKLKEEFDERNKNINNGRDRAITNWVNQYPSDKIDFIKSKEVLREKVSDDVEGYESDSSSDLFELRNYDLGFYNSSTDQGLPVYETTHMDSIKRGAPIANGAS